MSGEANVWEPRVLIAISGDTKSIEERIVASASQSIFAITTYTYVPGTGALEIHQNGLLLAKGVDWHEVSENSFYLTTPAAVNDVIIATGKVGITGVVPVEGGGDSVSLPAVASYALLRLYSGDETVVYVTGASSVMDGGEGIFYKRDTGTPSFYTDDSEQVIVPIGGDGSVAWVSSANKKSYAPFASVAALKALPLPVRVNGATAIVTDVGGQSEWVTVNAVGHGLTEDTYVILVQDANWYARRINILATGADAIIARTSLQYLMGQMQGGNVVTIACYGDSTTAGFGLAGYVDNPVDGGGVPNGTIDYNETVTLAWPKKLQTELRIAYDNTNIKVYNLGYSGRSLADGWAYDNYEAALDNPNYPSVPNATIMAFGLNDVGLTVGSDRVNFLLNQEALILKMLNVGTIPILMTCDPIMLNGAGTILDNEEVVREIDQVKRYLADKYNIPLIDVYADLMELFENQLHDGENPQRSWGVTQDDNLHVNSTGHSYKAHSVFRHLYKDIATFHRGDKIFPVYSSYANNPANTYSRYKYSNVRQGGNISWGSSEFSGTNVIVVYVWNTCQNAWAVYQGLSNEGVTSGASTRPLVSRQSMLGNPTQYRISAATLPDTTHGWADSDVPYILGRMKYGLNKLYYTAGTSAVSYYGYFRAIEGNFKLPEDALYGIRTVERRYTATTGIYYDPLPPARDLANLAGAGLIDDLSGTPQDMIIRFTANLPQYSGFMVLNGNAFLGYTIDSIERNAQSSIILHRDASDRLVMSVAYWNKLGVGSATVIQIGISAALVWAGDHEFVGRFHMVEESGAQRIRVYSQYHAGAAIIDVTLTNTWGRWAGYVGGTYFDSDTAATTHTVKIQEILIERPSTAAIH